MTRPIVWSVGVVDAAGLDGLAADQRALEALGVHVCPVAAGIGGPGWKGGHRAQALSPDLLEAQLSSLLPALRPDVIKIGHLGSAENGRVLARTVRRLRERAPVALVVDPAGPEGQGAAVADAGWRRVLREELLPLAAVCVLRRREAAWLLGEPMLEREGELLSAIPALESLAPCSWLLTQNDSASDLLLSPQFQGWMEGPHIQTLSDQGRGATLASALAGALAQSFCEADAAVLAKMAVAQGLQEAESVGTGLGAVRVSAGFARRLEHLPVARRLSGIQGLDAARGFTRLDEDLGLCAVVDSVAWVERLARCGVRNIQLRIKRRPDAALQAEIREALSHTRATGARLYVNQHWRLAIDLGADGLHLDPEDFASGVDFRAVAEAGLGLGLSARTLWELAEVVPLRPSYIAFGPVHSGRMPLTPWRAQGSHNLAYVCGLLNLPLLAIGGLTPERVRHAARCGIAGFGVGAGITSSFDPEAEVDAFQRAWAEGRRLLPLRIPDLPQSSLTRQSP